MEAGLVKLVRLEETGKELIVCLRTPGWPLAAAAGILQQPFPVSGITLTPCHLRRIPIKDFYRYMKTNEEFSWYIHKIHSHEILDQTIRAGELGHLSAKQRIEHMLWELIPALEQIGPLDHKRFQLPLKQSEIAQLIAVTPEHLSRVLKQMEAKGIVQRKKGWIIVSDPQKLYHPTDL